jgi:hypothetical protein
VQATTDLRVLFNQPFQLPETVIFHWTCPTGFLNDSLRLIAWWGEKVVQI